MRAVAHGKKRRIIDHAQISAHLDEPIVQRQVSLREPAMRHRPRSTYAKRSRNRGAPLHDHLCARDLRHLRIKRKAHPQVGHAPPHHRLRPGRHARKLRPMFHHCHSWLRPGLTQGKCHRHRQLTTRHTAANHSDFGRQIARLYRYQKRPPPRCIDIKRLGRHGVFGKPRQVHLGRDAHVD